MSENAKRLLTLLMAVSILISALPMGVNAQEQDPDETVTTVQTLPATKEPTPETTVPETSEPTIPEPIVPDVPATEPDIQYPRLELDVQQEVVISAAGEYAILAFTPAEDGTYIFTSMINADTYAILYDSNMNEIMTDDDGGVDANFSIRYNMVANTTYYFGAKFLSGEMGSFPVVVQKGEPIQLVSLEFSPITVIENTKGNATANGWNYSAWEILISSYYTATFADGTVISGRNSGFYYADSWHAFQYTCDQSTDDPWTVDNTYTITVSVLNQSAQLKVTIVESPLQSLSFSAVTAIENTKGYESDGAWRYYISDLLSASTYVATFEDGFVSSGNSNGLYYNDVWYSFEYTDPQNTGKLWKVGNTYYLTVSVLGQSAQLEVTIVESPLQSLYIAPITAIENTKGYFSDGYWHYYIGELLSASSFTAFFKDGTSESVSGSGLWYGDTWYSFTFTDNQSRDNPWIVGNTYTITAYLMGQKTEVPITISKTPVENVTFDPICLEEYKGGAWYGDYYRYSWQNELRYTVTFSDGSTQTGTRWDNVYYNGLSFSVSNCTDDQGSMSPWLSGNTYCATAMFDGKQYPVYVTISKTVEDNSFEYMIQNGQAIITGSTAKTEILQIPTMIYEKVYNRVYGYPVTGITGLGNAPLYAKEIRIPDSVTMLSSSAFKNASGVRTLVIGSGITELQDWMLHGATNLKDIYVSKDNPALCVVDGVLYDKAVTRMIFYPPQKKDLHIIPDSVTNVNILFEGSGRFSGINFKLGANIVGYKEVDGVIYNEDMTRVLYCTAAATGKYVMPESVKEIERLAFMNSSLTDVTISPNVTEITYWSFKGSAIESITIPGSVCSIGFQAFDGCDNLEKINVLDIAAWCQIDLRFGDNPLRYGDLYVNGVLSNDLVLPDVVTRVYPKVFAESHLTSITIPATLTRIDYSAFENCAQLKKVYISDVAAWCRISFDDYTANPLSYARDLYLNGALVKDLVIPEDMEYPVAPYAFYNSSITSLTVPGKVYMIGSHAFKYSNLESVTFEEGIRNIQYGAFTGSALKSLDLPDSLEYIGSHAFYNCADLTQVSFGSGLIEIHYRAFMNTGLKLVDLPDNVEWIDDQAFTGIKATQIKLPEGVTSISYRTFALNQYLISVTIPTGLQHIDFTSFEDTYLSHVLYEGTADQWAQVENYSPEIEHAIIHFNATGNEITVQEDCTSIQYYCTVCNRWETLRKPENTHTFVNGVCTICGHEGEWDYIVDQAKRTIILTGYLGSAKKVTLPDTIAGLPVTGMTSGIFNYNREVKEITLPETITQIGSYAFQDCTFLEKVNVGSKLTAVGDFAFSGCRSLRNINLPEGTTSIGNYAFYGCDMSEFTIPSTVTNIGEYAFYGCDMTKVEIPAGVTQIAYYAFGGCYDLVEVILPDTVQSIDYRAFYASMIQELTIPASVTVIGDEAFRLGSYWGEPAKLIRFLGNKPAMGDNWLICEKAVAFYPATANGWDGIFKQGVAWYASAVPEILKQPGIVEAVEGETAKFAVEAYGHRLSYQWYLAAPGSDVFNPVGGNSFELNVTAGETTFGTRAYCVVTDVLGQTTQTEVGELKLHEHAFEYGYCAGCGAYTGNCGVEQTTTTYDLTLDFAGVKATGSRIPVESVWPLFENAASAQGLVYASLENVFAGNLSGGAFNTANGNADGHLRLGTTSAQGKIVLTFAGKVSKVEITCHDWYQKSAAYPTNRNYLSVNGSEARLVPYTEDSTMGVLTFDIAASNTVTINSSWDQGTQPGGRVFISKIVVTTEGEADSNLTWLLDKTGDLTISGTGDMADVGEKAPWGDLWESIKNVIIEDGVTSIGYHAFAGFGRWSDPGQYEYVEYTNLVSITIPDSVTSIGAGAFQGCSSLTSIDLPDNVSSLGAGAFQECRGLTSITIPGSVTTIPTGIFQGCTNLTEVILEDGVTTINPWAFARCYSLKTIRIPSSLTNVNLEAFATTDGLEQVIYCGTEAQWNKIVFEADNAFLVHADRTYHKFQEATCIAPETCRYCDATQGHPHNPENNICVDCGIYCGECGYNAYWELDENGTIYIRGFGKMHNYAPGKAPWYFLRAIIKRVVIGNATPKRNGAETDVTHIGSYAFYGCSKIVDVTLDEGIETIGESAFYGNSRLTDITIPDSVAEIGNRAFYGCYSMADVTVGNGTAFIGEYAFEDCYSMTNVTLGENVNVIGGGAFSGCTGLTAIELPKNVTTIEKGTFQGCSNLEVVVLPEQLDTISIGAFDGCSELTNVYSRGNADAWNEVLIAGGNDVLEDTAVVWEYTATEVPKGCEHIWAEATCTAPKTCTLCGGAFAADSSVLPHTEDAAVKENVIDATCVAAGSYESVIYCSVCNAELSRETIPGDPATGEHTYEDGKCTECGAEEPVVRKDILGVHRAASLSLKDVVFVNPTIAFKTSGNANVPGLSVEYVLANGRILFWDKATWEALTGDPVLGTETELSMLENAGTYTDNKQGDVEPIQEYKGKSMGIPAKNFNDTIYYRTYIEIDGEVYYGDILTYSVVTYCTNQINSSKTTDQQNKLRALCATMLNFGAAAQIQQGYDTANLANAILPSLAESGKLDSKYLKQNWDENLLKEAATPDEALTVNFTQSGAKITAKTLQLKGAIEMKVTMGYKLNGDFATQVPEDATITYYFWSSDDYAKLAANGTALSKENASYTKSSANAEEVVANAKHNTYGYEYYAMAESIPARKLDQTVYFVAIVTEADGTEYCTGVNSYSPMQYAINQLAKATTSSNEKLQDLCRWMVLYCDAAKAVLG